MWLNRWDFPTTLEAVATDLGITETTSTTRPIYQAAPTTPTSKPIQREKVDAWQPINPVPDDAPEPPRHYKMGEPSRRWTYRDAEGRVLFNVCRFDKADGEKEVLPLTFCQNEDGKRQWRWKGLPAPRPLYNLDGLTAKPEATVIVTEGEKAADAVVAIFPEWVATTSPNGSGSANNADWSPLVGRRVVIWPDHDDKGTGYADAVSAALRQVEAESVQWLRLEAFLRLSGLPEREALPDKWDAADAVAEGAGQETGKAFMEDPANLVDPRLEREATQERGSDQWPDPEPIRTELKPVPSFDPELLPEALRAWVLDIAFRMKCPPEFPAVAAIVGLAAVVGRKVAIHPKARDNWRVVPNLWGVLIGRPSVLKSPAMAEALKPLDRLEIDAKERYEKAKGLFAVDSEVATLNMTAAKSAATKALKDGLQDKARDLLRGAVEDVPEEPVRQRFVTSDATIEKLGELLNQNPNGLLLKRDELAGFLKNLDREDRSHERPFYLEAFNGDGRFTVDRIGRGTVDIESVTLSIIGTIQPGRLAAYVASALSMDSGDDGFIQRFQLAVYPDVLRDSSYRDQWPDKDAKERAWEVFQALAGLATPIEEQSLNEPYALRFDGDAQEMFREWLTDLERELFDSGLHPAMESHLAKYRSLGPSLALLFHLIDGGGLSSVGSVATARAFAWCDLLRAHAERIYATAIDQATVAAGSLLVKIRDGKLENPFKVKEVHQKGWTGLDTGESVKSALKVLIEAGHVREETATAGPNGGRPSVNYRVNPKTLEDRP